jgi:hypothetical protein
MRGFLVVVVLMLVAPIAAAAERKVSGSIVRFECGDNCYLTIKTTSGEELTGLCAAKTCESWNETTEMPAKFIGANVRVTVGTGKQYDGSGNEVGDFPAFSTVAFVK